MVGIAVVGAGNWGKNLVRAFASAKGASLKFVCDTSEKVLKTMAAADFDRNNIVGQSDTVIFLSCANGPNNPPSPNCPAGVNADLDNDGDVDQTDFGLFQQRLNGP